MQTDISHSDDLRESARAAVDALDRLRRSALRHTGGQPRSDAKSRGDAKTFSLTWHEQMSPETLLDDALRQAGEREARQLSLSNGRVYCYSCATVSCEHAVPPEPGMVFAGYQATGRPIWEEFFSFMLRMGDNRTDLLFATRPKILARVVGHRRLTEEQLTSFGKNSLTYRILGEVVAGYLHIGDTRGALTVQMVETKDHELHLHIVTDQAVLETLVNASEKSPSSFYRIYDSLIKARRRISSLNTQWHGRMKKGKRRQLTDKGFSVLKHLANSIERKGRQHYRRTRHAEQRNTENRPVHKAYEDLLDAAPDDFFHDTMRKSLIVVGKAGRLHAFSRQGKHLTSMRIRGDKLRRRQERKRYVPVEADRIPEIRKMLRMASAERDRR